MATPASRSAPATQWITSLPEVLYPALEQVRPARTELGVALAPVQVAANTVLFLENAPCQGFPLVLEGEIKVSRRSDDGRSIELYRVVPGELCLVSSSCLFRAQPLSAHGITTKDSSLIMIPPDIFRCWLATPAFRDEVLGLFAEPMADLTSLIDAVAFHKLDCRLAAALLGHGQQLNVSRQSLANELGTVREIITRLLHRFEREGWVILAREQIQISNSTALRQLASALAS